jgi:PAS domain-containing protein
MDEPVITGRTATRPLDDVVGEALTARVTVDERGTVTGWNAGAERLLGYAADQIVGRPATELLPEPVPAEDLPSYPASTACPTGCRSGRFKPAGHRLTELDSITSRSPRRSDGTGPQGSTAHRRRRHRLPMAAAA